MTILLKFLKDNWLTIFVCLALAAAIASAYNLGKTFGNLEKYTELAPVIAALEKDKTVNLEKNLKLQQEVTKLTNDFADQLNVAFNHIDESYQKGLQDGKKKPEAIIAEYAAANKRLSIDLKRAKVRTSCDSDTSGGTSSSGLSDDTERAELSDAAAGFLISEADRADEVVLQLTACQAVSAKYYTNLVELNKKISALEKR